ncbi:MAG: ArnT family glycosyltransferase [Halodesulfurarchaeum sp.]
MPPQDWRSVGRLAPTIDERWVRLGLPLSAATIVYLVYLSTHPYPAYGAGLFLEIAEQLAANGFGLPTRIHGYTTEGMPFAYPPLAFYVVAMLVDGVGIDPVTVTRLLPGLLVVVYLLPYYGIASELLASSRQATVATTLFATTPVVLRWHLSGGGIVRSVALLFALCSVYAGIRLYRTNAPRWLGFATVTIALVVLTHPTYTVFVVLTYPLLFLALDRSPRGFVAGAVVGLGGLALAAPWLLAVTATHGIDVFFAASGTHGGIGAGPSEFLTQLGYPLTELGTQWLFYGLAYLGAAYALWRRRWLLPTWLLAAVFVTGKHRFLYVPGSLLSAAFVFEVIAPAVRERLPESAANARRAVPMLVAGIVAILAVTAGVLYGAGVASDVPGGHAAQPQFVDADDWEAMEWAERNTPPDATFVVLGDAAEWMPYVSNRTILVGPWGTEWKDSTEYYAQVDRFEETSTCPNETCLASSIDRLEDRPDYVYVPTGRYTVRSRTYVQESSMSASLGASENFRVVFENDGVVIAKIVEDGTDTPRLSVGSPR